MERTKTSWYRLGNLERIIFITGISLSLLFSYNFYTNQKKDFIARTNRIIEKSLSNLDRKLNIYDTVLIQIQTYIITLSEINEDLFHRYYTNLSNLFDFNEFKAIGYSKFVTQKELTTFYRIHPQYKIWPFTKKEVYIPLLYIEPRDFYEEDILGFDQSSEEKRFKAYQIAKETGQTISTGMITVPMSKRPLQKSFLLIKSIYSGHNYQKINPNVNGFVFAQFTYHDFFNEVWANFKDDIDYQVFERSDENHLELLFSSSEDLDHKRFSIDRKKKKFGNTYLIKFFPQEKFTGIYRNTFLIFMTGLTLTLLILRNLNHAKKRAIETDLHKDKLEQTLKSRDDFISITSHELKNPLTSLKLKAQFLKKKKERGQLKESDCVDFSFDIEQQVLRLEMLVNDILDLSRMRTEQFSYTITEFNLCDLISNTLIRMSEQFKEPPHISNPEKEIIVRWDKFRIEQVLINLLTNAIKYGENSSIGIRIAVDMDDVTISVSDEGRGIAPEARETIFNRFDRAGITTNEISGLGLGLYITHQIVTYHKGKIWVDSQLGEGSTFYVKIPKYPHR